MASIISLNSWFRDKNKILNKHYLLKRLNIKFFIGIIKKLFFEYRYSDRPWLTNNSINFLNNWIRPDDFILEFGSGQSTLWFANKSKHVTSIEHNRRWYQQTLKKINHNLLNTKLILANNRQKYLQIIKKIHNKSIDICLIDGQWRIDCLLGVLKKIKTGGLIIFDNAETFLPITWPSLSFQDSWQEKGCHNRKKVFKIMSKLKKWRIISTTDVSQDTVFFIKK